MSFVIESDIPVPKRTAGRTGSKYPFSALNEGESFLIPHGYEEVKIGTIRSAIGAYMKRAGEDAGKFAVRAVDGGVRVWRV